MTSRGLQDKVVRNGGRYIYGVAPVAASGFKSTGINGSPVYTVLWKDVCAIVHECSLEPRATGDIEQLKELARTHHAVLSEARERFGMVIPLGLNVVIHAEEEASEPDGSVKKWLSEDYERIKTIIRKISGKDEYGVQIHYKPAIIGEQLWKENSEVKRIMVEMETMPQGMKYLYRHKIERLMQGEIGRLAGELFKDFYRRIKQYCYDITVEKIRKTNNEKVMLLNLSCLVARDRVDGLGEELEKIDRMDGFSVHFSGPWPPYTFVAKPIVAEKKV